MKFPLFLLFEQGKSRAGKFKVISHFLASDIDLPRFRPSKSIEEIICCSLVLIYISYKREILFWIFTLLISLFARKKSGNFKIPSVILYPIFLYTLTVCTISRLVFCKWLFFRKIFLNFEMITNKVPTKKSVLRFFFKPKIIYFLSLVVFIAHHLSIQNISQYDINTL